MKPPFPARPSISLSEKISTNYLWDNSAASEVSQRFDSLAAMFDPNTFRYMESLGVREGWKCLEVGGGGGSVARWLSAKVGKTGSVLVTDINPLFLKDLKGTSGNVDVLLHDITKETGIPRDTFDQRTQDWCWSILQKGRKPSPT